MLKMNHSKMSPSALTELLRGACVVMQIDAVPPRFLKGIARGP